MQQVDLRCAGGKDDPDFFAQAIQPLYFFGNYLRCDRSCSLLVRVNLHPDSSDSKTSNTPARRSTD
jgi:hypothetical protein